MILVADVGGTNTRIALGDGARRLHRLRALKNTDIEDFRATLAETLADAGEVQTAVFAVAGPVDSDEVKLTNYPRQLSRAELQTSLGLKRVVFVNDFVAAVHAVPALAASDVIPLQAGHDAASGNVLVCGPGTGFGAAALVRAGERSVSVASEAGHMVLGGADETENQLFARIFADGRARSVEAVISGGGLRTLYRAIAGKERRSEEIIAAARVHDNEAVAAVAAFMRVFGRLSGDLALAYNALGGIYIAGGLGRALAPLYLDSPFLDAFNDHPPYGERMRRIPVRLIVHEHPNLIGALQIGLAE
jgi:glucokinase